MFDMISGFGGSALGYILPFLFVLTIVVFFHELGHFMVARWCGVKVDAFSIGFGPELFGWNDKHDTRWRVAAIPLGGYVRFHGDENAASAVDREAVADMPEEQRKVSFHYKPLWQRAAIVAAGPFANFILAIVIFAGTFAFVGQYITPARVDTVQEGSAAERAGIVSGDTIVSIDGKKIESFNDLQRIVSASAGIALEIVLERGGDTVSVTAIPDLREVEDRFGNKHNVGLLGVASKAEADSLLQIADRELKRIDELRGRGVSSESQRDVAKAEQLAKQAQVKVTRARIASAEADLAAARIRLGYTQVTADWRGGSERRVVAERYVDEGQTLAANAPLLRIVELDPITAVFFVTERDYARLRAGQSADIATDAFPGDSFSGTIERIAPVFLVSTRQALVELHIDNPDLRLKPGMFARATVTLQRVADAVTVPQQALTSRDGRDGVFLVGGDGETAVWHAVQPGILQAGRVQLIGAELAGRVVTLGQQLLEDGAPLRVSAERSAADR